MGESSPNPGPPVDIGNARAPLRAHPRPGTRPLKHERDRVAITEPAAAHTPPPAVIDATLSKDAPDT
ncbi:hypothetical protein [Nocardiopsis sp. B62]|uniref:hypothetical protein n=1 Tax=Nocardiopsis sp. B62 TaxID=2824874 RepID=UPI001B398A61|nr:hypothetical protein [Nocardiopsis sp. B62]MBQ1079792.1 hypothetical protein [Nocardiopsis sp. B62]